MCPIFRYVKCFNITDSLSLTLGLLKGSLGVGNLLDISQQCLPRLPASLQAAVCVYRTPPIYRPRLVDVLNLDKYSAKRCKEASNSISLKLLLRKVFSNFAVCEQTFFNLSIFSESTPPTSDVLFTKNGKDWVG